MVEDELRHSLLDSWRQKGFHNFQCVELVFLVQDALYMTQRSTANGESPFYDARRAVSPERRESAASMLQPSLRCGKADGSRAEVDCLRKRMGTTIHIMTALLG